MAIKNVGAAWDKKTKKGDDCISVSIELKGQKVNFYLYKNQQKKKDGQPDWNACAFIDDAPGESAPAAPEKPVEKKEEKPPASEGTPW